MFYESIFPFASVASPKCADLIPLHIFTSIPSSNSLDFPFSTSPSSTFLPLSDDSIVQIHHDFDEDIQEFLDVSDSSHDHNLST